MKRRPRDPSPELLFNGRVYATSEERAAAVVVWGERRRRLLELIERGR